MFYKLKSDYMLRGWKFLPTGVINRENHEYMFLPMDKFAVLKKCDGFLSSDSEFCNENREIITEFLGNGLIDEKNEPSPLEDAQRYKFYENRFINSAHWSITGKCNCKCRHCYMSAPQHKVEEFTHEQCFDIISQLSACGVQTIALTGGEALIRKDFWEIVDELTAKDIKITAIFSNGLLINEKFCSELEKRGLNPSFQISFDGINGCHDWIRGIDGAEKAAIRAIKLLLEKNYSVTCAFGLHKGNLHVFRETVQKLASLGINNLRVAPISEDGEALGMSDKILSTEELFNFYLDYIPQYIADGAPIKLSLSGVFDGISTSEYNIPMVTCQEGKNIDRNCLCGAIRNGIHIDFAGFVMPCPPMSFNDAGKKHFSRIFDVPLKNMLNGAYMDFINTRMGDYFKKNPQCAACEYKNRCSGGCRGNAMADNGDGDLLGIDKKTCLFFKGGYYDKVRETAEKLNLKHV